MVQRKDRGKKKESEKKTNIFTPFSGDKLEDKRGYAKLKTGN